MSDLVFTLISIGSIIAIALLAGLYPLRVAVGDDAERRLILGNALAGGIFLGAALLHMLPDSVEIFDTLDAGEPLIPWPFFLGGLGYLLILFLEKVVLRGRDEEDVGSANASVPILLFVILSVHSLIAGAALGLDQNLTSSLAILIAILAHKGFAAFALGVSLVRAQVPARRVVGTITAFSLTTPTGVLLGTIAAAFLGMDGAGRVEFFFDALAAGTFLYVGISEILADVFDEEVDARQKIGLVVLGFLAMTLLAIWA